MSGPKVIRIVTREERLAQSTAIAHRLQQALHRWRTAAQQAGELNAEELAQTLERHTQLAQALASDDFDRFNQAAGREVAFLESDLELRRQRAALRRAGELQAQLRGTQNARTLLQALESKGVALDAQLRRALELAAQGKASRQAAEAALASGFRRLSPGEQAPTLTPAQRQLAARLAEDGEDLSLAQWKAAQKPTADDPRVAAIARQLEMLRLLGAQAATVAVFEQRLDQCLQAPAHGMVSMQLDSLMVELAQAVREVRALEAWIEEAVVLASELSALHCEHASQALTQLQSALAERDSPAIQRGLEVGRGVLAESAKVASAHARRTAVLQNLAQLGYAVHEGMETAWVEAGRIVVHKPSLDGYAVELSGAPDAQRLQVRTVALSEDRDTSRDTDAEHLWCGDFTSLKDQLARQGTNVSVEKALGVGSVPLKLALDQGADASRTALRSTRAAP